jgi:hypothetical protein
MPQQIPAPTPRRPQMETTAIITVKPQSLKEPRTITTTGGATMMAMEITLEITTMALLTEMAMGTGTGIKSRNKHMT